MQISFPSNTTEIIDAIRNAIGRPVDFLVPVISGCSTCSLDPVTNTSTDAFCTTCSGVYWIKSYDTTTISGHVTWKPSDILGWYTGGQVFEGDCRVQVKYTLANKELIEEAEKILVDGKDMQKLSSMYRGVPSINRILIDLQERNKDE